MEQSEEIKQNIKVQSRESAGSYVIAGIVGILIGVLTILLFFAIRYRKFIGVIEAASTIESEYLYYDQTGGEDTLVTGAVKGMTAWIRDDYAQYYTKEEYAKLLESESGKYEGIGILLGKPDDTGALILRVYEGGSMEAAGAAAGDLIISINGKKTAGLTLSEVTDLLDKNPESSNRMELIRDGKMFEIEASFAQVQVPYVSFEMLSGGTGYIELDSFLGNAPAEMEEAIKTLLDRGMRSLVLDLRGNPGGGLDELIRIAGLFLKKGDLLTTMKDRNGKTRAFYVERDGYEFPMAVLVNKGTASAAELLSGALQAYGRATIIGTTTFGKGIVQSHYNMKTTGGVLKLTTEAYYTPDDVCIHKTGITPDITVETPDGYSGDTLPMVPHEQDIQLQKAVALFAE